MNGFTPFMMFRKEGQNMNSALSTSKLHNMTPNSIEISSTSSTTADASPIVLHETDLLRLMFIPKLVENQQDPAKPVSGKLLYEKKRKNDDAFPSDINDTSKKVSRGSAKVGDWMEFQFDTSETYKLYKGLQHLYELYEEIGRIPYGTATYTRIDSAFRKFLSIIQNEPSEAIMIGEKENYNLIKILLQLISKTNSLDYLRKNLSELQNESIQHLSSSLNFERLQRVANLMQENLDNSNEEFWQKDVFKENQWVLAQIFSCPFTIYEDKAYVGGKGIDNKNGNVCDFIYQNKISQNIALIEIKTPCTEIIGGEYRGTVSFSQELSGAVNQVLNYRDNLMKLYYMLSNSKPEPFSVVMPKCVIIIGKLASMKEKEISAFENFRNSLNNIIIMTFDELHKRIVDLIKLLS